MSTAEKFDIAKLMRGFNIFSGANTGKLIYTLIIIAIALGIFYKVFIQRTIGQTQASDFKGASISNIDMRQTKGDNGWSVGGFGGVINHDNDTGWFGGVSVTKKF